MGTVYILQSYNQNRLKTKNYKSLGITRCLDKTNQSVKSTKLCENTIIIIIIVIIMLA